MKTKDRIIAAACELFNEHGERAITTNHIASHLGISPGNLYYYFRNKEQIIRAIFDQYEEYLSAAYGPDNQTEGLMQDYLDKMFQGMWRFRFVYASLSDILARDPELHKRYLKSHHQVMNTAIENLQQMIDHGAMKIDPAMLTPFAEGIKMVVTFWISHLYTQNLDKPITESMVYQGVVQILAMFHGYITPQFKPEFDRIVAHYSDLASDISQPQAE
ncbi:TetR/AcrR family transcriptional regulator [Ferrimonas lipolytica]|uniref:TetR/AcrR family transcriptional regulator n=1 Tax=Ferrimonas lipolytica TaxID=2724191 RepID=A0A6H1UKN5_9GAMM|nr:TetR/AcrR family transcriptional regulator [Ferrimonas lipolytica]QIZ78362.1 TetR/AcrR family transcriptional regulator [Ferrimonas lipolytica]